MKNTRVLIRAKGRGLCIERGLYDCLQRELFADVSLNCDGSKIRANKGVLAAASPVLANLLKDWPITEDACVIMAGYTEEEVQGLVQYIYTGQLATPPNSTESSGWEKIIEDFKVGLPPDSDSDKSLGNESLKQEEHSPHETASNGTQTNRGSGKPAVLKGVGPKIVSVTSPRPLIVQVQSLTPNQSQPAISDQESISDVNENNEIPFEMSIDETQEDFDEGTSAVAPVANKRKRVKSTLVSPRKARRKAVLEPRSESSLVEPLESATLKKMAAKRGKPMSKFSRKKYRCPYCNRRFLTRGNVKNHMRIHARDKPFQCPICQDLFAYQGVYQRHLHRHRENNEITDEDMAPILAESLRLAEELAKHGQNPVHVGDDASEDLGDAEEMMDEVEESDDDVDDAKGRLANNETKCKADTKSPGSSRTDVGVHFLCTEDKKEELVLSEDELDDEGLAASKQSVPEASTASGTPAESSVVRKKGGTKGKGVAKEKKDKPKHRMNYQIIECDYCPMKYHKWSAFYVHRCTHTGETPVLPCGVCDMEFPNIKALKEHKTTAHPSAVFQCDQCERSFLSRSALLMHQPVHSTKLNFQCRYCQAKMRTLKERYVHERIHTADETPYSCSQCDKQFNTLVNLRSHLKLHTNEQESTAA